MKEAAIWNGVAGSRPLSSHNLQHKKKSVAGGFSGTSYTGACGHRRLQSALIVGTKINAVNTTEEEVAGRTAGSVKMKRVRGKLDQLEVNA